MTSSRRQKPLQFITTELLLIVMDQQKTRGSHVPVTLNPSDMAEKLSRNGIILDLIVLLVDITRRRIYDIIHILNCVGVISRLNYRIYSWSGWEGFQYILKRAKALSVCKMIENLIGYNRIKLLL